MGVIQEARQEVAEADDAADSGNDAADTPLISEDVVEWSDPFVHEYETERYSADDETINQMLTGIIAVANVV